MVLLGAGCVCGMRLMCVSRGEGHSVYVICLTYVWGREWHSVYVCYMSHMCDCVVCFSFVLIVLFFRFVLFVCVCCF